MPDIEEMPGWKVLKDEGNAAFAAKDFSTATAKYSEAIAASGFRSIPNALVRQGKTRAESSKPKELKLEAPLASSSAAPSSELEVAAEVAAKRDRAAASILYSNRAACWLQRAAALAGNGKGVGSAGAGSQLSSESSSQSSSRQSLVDEVSECLEEAIVDAASALSLDRTNVKAIYRKAQAEVRLGEELKRGAASMAEAATGVGAPMSGGLPLPSSPFSPSSGARSGGSDGRRAEKAAVATLEAGLKAVPGETSLVKLLSKITGRPAREVLRDSLRDHRGIRGPPQKKKLAFSFATALSLGEGEGRSASKRASDAAGGGGGGVDLHALAAEGGLYGDRSGAGGDGTRDAARRILGRLRKAIAEETAGGRGASVPIPEEWRQQQQHRPKGGGGSLADAAGAVVDGVFMKLLDKSAFQRAVYPGLSEEQRRGAPQSLQELVESPAYAKALEESAVPAAMAQAESVLRNVRAKGAAAGDVMDDATARVLWPQIVNEALARQIVALVQRLHRASHLLSALDDRNAAEWEGVEEADWGQLDEALLWALGATRSVPNPTEGSDEGGKRERSGFFGNNVSEEDKAAVLSATRKPVPPAAGTNQELAASSPAAAFATAASLAAASPGYGFMDGFMNDGWSAAVLDDVKRMLGVSSTSRHAASGGASGGDGGGGKKSSAATKLSLAAKVEASRRLDASSPAERETDSSGRAKGYEMTPFPVPERVEEGSNGDVLWLDFSAPPAGPQSSSSSSSAPSPPPPPSSHDADAKFRGQYPALAEVITNLHALPHELNKVFAEERQEAAAEAPPRPPHAGATREEDGVEKRAAGGGGGGGDGVPADQSLRPLELLRLARAGHGGGAPGASSAAASTALVRLRPGNQQLPRLDCDSRAGRDSGHRLTALLFLPPDIITTTPTTTPLSATATVQCKEEDFGGHLVLQSLHPSTTPASQAPQASRPDTTAAAAATSTLIEAKPNRLVIWRSDSVINSRTDCKKAARTGESEGNEASLYAIQFWMHGMYLHDDT